MFRILTLAGAGHAWWWNVPDYGDFPTDDGTGNNCGKEWWGSIDGVCYNDPMTVAGMDRKRARERARKFSTFFPDTFTDPVKRRLLREPWMFL